MRRRAAALVPALLGALIGLPACSADSDAGADPGSSTGASGGSMGASTGGSASGGLGTGGTSNAGGSTSSGGFGAIGGAGPSNGGTSSGGDAAAGGAPTAGGTSSSGGAPPAGGTGGIPITPSGDVIFAAPDGVDAAAGTMTAPTTLTAALTRVSAGGSIALRGGTYVYSKQLTVDLANSGSAGKPKSLAAYNGEKPVLDFSTEPYGADGNARGFQINGDHWHVTGLEVKGAADNGIYVAGNDNVIESCITHGNRDTGLQIGRASSTQTTMADWPSNNLVLNCESYDNYDAPPGSGENADGFAAKLTVGPGNVFRGCVSHHNIDDGWDLYTKSDTGPIGSVTIDACISHHNGTLTNGTKNDNGDRNGFKLGGEKIAVGHTVTRSVAFANGKNGFTWNSNPGQIRLSNNLAFDNVEGNYLFGSSSVSTQAVFANDVSFWTSTASDTSDKTVGTDVSSSNAFWDASRSQPSINGKGLVVTAADFAASLAAPKIARNADGSLDMSVFALSGASDLKNAGVTPPGALPFDAATYYSGAPDLGAVEAR